MLKQYNSLAELMDKVPWIKQRWAGRNLRPSLDNTSHAYYADNDVETYDTAEGCCMLGMLDYYMGAPKVDQGMSVFADSDTMKFLTHPALLVDWLHVCSIVVGKRLATDVFNQWKYGHTWNDKITDDDVKSWTIIPHCNDSKWVNLADMQDLAQAVEQYAPFQSVVKLTRMLRDPNQPLAKKLDLARPFYYQKVWPYLKQIGYQMYDIGDYELLDLMAESNLI